MSRRDLVAAALREPGAWAAPQPASLWSDLVGQARTAGLLARVGLVLARTALGDRAPEAILPEELAAAGPWPASAAPHFASAWRLSQAQLAEVRREAQYIAAALAPLAVPCVLLKGAAYAMAHLPAATGRVFSDIDILVPEAELTHVEGALLAHGWVDDEPSRYNQRYYREWMHELPPLRHGERQTTLDVHHALLPRTARWPTPSAPLFERIVPLADWPGLFVLSRGDRVLHSAVHLFANEQMGHALRDLSDLDLLLRDAAADPDFWPGLVERGHALGLARPLAYALHHTHRLLGTPVPPGILAATQAALPRGLWRPVMHALWACALRSPHPLAQPRLGPWAQGLLYLRGHWLRMPLPMLMRHLAIKTLGLHREATPEAGADGG